MSEKPRVSVDELMDQIEAAGVLIGSLEEEVAGLRHDLERANAALGAAREEVAARGRALEDLKAAGDAEEAAALGAEITALKQAHADEQVRLGNEHINELAELRRTLEEQRRADVAAAGSDERAETLKEEFRREREALEERHRADLEALETSAKHWEEKLREGYREQEERHRAEIESILGEQEERRAESERSLRDYYERRLGEERGATKERHEATLAALNSAASGRERELQENYRAVVESQQQEIEALRKEIEARDRRMAEERKEAAREVKKLAEGRERDLKRAHAAKLAEVNREAERKLSALQAQKEADNRALLAGHEEEMARQRRTSEERLLAEDERRKQETWALEERLENLKIKRDSEMRSYNARFQELEAARLGHETSARENLERVVSGFDREIADLEAQVAKLQDALEEAESSKVRLENDLFSLRRSAEQDRFLSLRRASRGGEDYSSQARTVEIPTNGAASQPEEAAADILSEKDRRIEDLDARRILAEERVQALEARLEEAEARERRKGAQVDRLEKKLEDLSDPERRLREGIALFNESEHARAVASISKALGLPRVHAGVDGGESRRPVLTFIWPEMAWRRYISDPTEGVEEPRVYLSGTGDDPEELEDRDRHPNARMDSRGRLMLGVQAR